MIRVFSLLVCWILMLAFPIPLDAQVCNSAPTVASSQTEAYLEPILIDVLAHSADPEGEAMTLALVGGTCGAVGSVSLLLDVIQLTPPSMGLGSPCTITYRVSDESGNISGIGTVTVNNQTDPIFVDGFETGDTSVWSDTCQVACGAVPE